MTAREVAVGLIVAPGGNLLLQHRDDKPGLPGAGMWGLFGGHTEPGERPADAFLRELDEELGWRPPHFEPYMTGDVQRDGWDVISHVFAAHLDVPLDALTLHEGQAMALFAPHALPADAVPGIAALIQSFAASPAYDRMRRTYENVFTTGLLVDAGGRLLLQLRDDKPDIRNPGLWGSFGGRLEPYETPEDGFVRELEEELAWKPPRCELYAAFAYRRDGADRLVYAFSAPVVVPQQRLVLGEGQAFGFFLPNGLPAATAPDLRLLLARFVSSDVYLRAREFAASSVQAAGDPS